MEEVKRLDAARAARKNNNIDEAKKCYAAVYADDPECAEAKFFYRYYNLLSCAPEETFANFYELCKVIGPVTKGLSETGATVVETASIVAEILSKVRGLPAAVNKVLNELYKTAPGVELLSQVREAARMGIQMLYIFGDSIEKYMYPELPLIMLAIRAWESGVHRHWQWYSVGLDKKFADIYTDKVRKYSVLCSACKNRGEVQLPPREEADLSPAAKFELPELYNPTAPVQTDAPATADVVEAPVNEDGFSWSNGNYSVRNEDEVRRPAQNGWGNGASSFNRDDEDDRPAWGSRASSFNRDDEDDRPAWGNRNNNFDNDDKDDGNRPAWGDGVFGRNDDGDDRRPAWRNRTSGFNRDDDEDDEDDRPVRSSFDRSDRPTWGVSSFVNDDEDDDRPAWGSRRSSFDRDDDDDRPSFGNRRSSFDRDDDDDDRPAWGNKRGNGFGRNDDNDGDEHFWNRMDGDESFEQKRPRLENYIEKITADMIGLSCPVCQRRVLDNCGSCKNMTVSCPDCGTRIHFNVNDDGEMTIIINPNQKEEREKDR